MNRTVQVIILGVLTILTCTLSVVPLRSQGVASAQIQGLITDPSGAVIPNAKVMATQTSTGLVRTTLSGSDGTYVLPNLPVGPYSLDVQAGGFQAYVQTGIVLQVSNNVTINVTLKVGQVSQKVQVSANAAMVQTQKTSISQVVDQARIIDLPLNGRQATSLVLLAGASSNAGPASPTNDLTGSKNYHDAVNISVAGGQADGTNYLLDGAENMDAFSFVNLPFPFPDALQEFSVQTNSLSARYGFQGGATVNVVTKSGTNQFHGDAFEFVRNGDFNARDFFAASQDTLKRNQFGGTIGGPIIKNKLFGFFGTQFTRIRTAPPSSISYVPTPAVMNGDFSALGSAACQSNGVAKTFINPATGQPYAGNQVDPATFNSVALNALKYVPSSNNPCGELTYAIPEPQNENQYIGRADWNQSAKNTVFARYFIANYHSPASFNKNMLLTTQQGVSDRSQSAVLSDTYSISATTLNSAHVAWTRLAIIRGPAADFINWTDLGSNITSVAPNNMNLSVSGYFDGGDGSPAHFVNNSIQLADNVDMMRGRHHISLGAEWVHYQFNYLNVYEGNGSFNFNGQASGNALLDFMLGLPSTFQQGNETYYNGRQNYFGPYVEDNFQVTRRLNLNVGLRWEPYLPTREVFNRMEHFDAAAFIAGTKSSQFDNSPPGLFFPGDPGMPSGFTNDRLAEFGPRVGLAWEPTGNPNQVIRAGFGVFYNLMPTAYSEDQTQGPPWASEVNLSSPSGGLTNPFAGFPGGNPFPTPQPPPSSVTFVPEGAYWNYPLNGHPTSTDQWNLTYERQLAGNWLVSASYMGNKTSHIWTGEDINPGIYISGNCAAGQYGLTQPGPCSTTGNTNQRRLLYLTNPNTGSFYSDIYQADDGANAEYNGLLLRVEHRFAQNYTILANYTYSHCISEGDFGGDLGGADKEQPFNRNADRGNCGYDLRHVFNLSFVALSPHFQGVWTNRLLSNWQLAPIVTIHSGNWFSPMTGLDNSLTGIGLDRPDVIGNPYTRSTTGNLQWLNPNAFVPNALGTFGNAGAQSLVGPGYFDVDAGVSRYFAIREHQKLELRFEFFNLFNDVNFNTPDNTLQDSTFGQIQSDVAPRILQFALRYTF